MIGFAQWYAWDYRSHSTGRTAVEEYLERRGSQLSSTERDVLEAWRTSHFGLFEVQSVDPGRGMQLREIYTGKTTFVHDVSSSRALVRWDCVLTRVEKSGDRYNFSANGLTVPRNLLDELQDFVEKERKGQPPAEFISANTHRWHRLIQEMYRDRKENLRVVNKEGDPLEFCSATYQVVEEAALLSALRSVAGFEEERDTEEGAREFAWLEEGEGPRSSFGRIEIRGARLKLECNSRKRLERGRKLIEQAAGKAVSHLGDSFQSVKSALREHRAAPPRETEPGIPPEVEREILTKLQDEHYSKWPDQALPALDGRTPREAVRTGAGRRSVLEIIHSMENSEERLRREGRPHYDFSKLREQLGLERDE